MSPISKLKAWDCDLRRQRLDGFSSQVDRARAQSYEFWIDHGVLRRVWSNFAEVAPGIYRANQPDVNRLEKWKACGIDTVLNLRGASGSAPILLEAEACRDLGIAMIPCSLTACKAPPRDRLQELIALFHHLPRPFVMHCKSGADRAGLASAIYLLAIRGASMVEARKMLSPRFAHFKWTRTGILDHILDAYEVRAKAATVSFETWLSSEYDAEAMQAAFDAKRSDTCLHPTPR